MRNIFSDPEAHRIQSTFDTVRSDCASKMALIDSQRHRLIRSNWRWRLFLIVETLVIVAFIIASFFLIHSIGWFWALLVDAAVITNATDQFSVWRKRVEQAIKIDCREVLSDFSEQEEFVRHALEAAETLYHDECVSYKSYPPDWEWRRQIVLARDNHHCRNCGWPMSILSRRREFHIHHITLLARGGDNSLENLITLCHVCHRNVDAYHSRVRKNSKPNRRRLWGF